MPQADLRDVYSASDRRKLTTLLLGSFFTRGLLFGIRILEGSNLITAKLHRNGTLQQFQSDDHAPSASKLCQYTF